MKSEKGNVVFLILIAVALFAALSFAATQSSTGGSGDASKESRVMKASQTTQYMTSIESSVMKMQVSKGCDISDISFDMTGVTELAVYVHTPAAADRCRIFHPLGGAVSWAPPTDGINDGSVWVFTAGNLIQDVGTNDSGDPESAELIAVLPNVSKDFCLDMNRKLGLPNPDGDPPVEQGTYDATPYTGTFTATDEIVAAPGSEVLNGALSGCFESQGTGTYHYFHVLQQR